VSRSLVAALFMVSLCASAALAQNDQTGSKDYPGIPRMPGHYIYIYNDSPYEAFAFPVMQNGKRTDERVEGRLVKVQYRAKADTQRPSPLQIARNYQNAVKSIGGEILDDRPAGGWHETTLRTKKDGKETWIFVKAEGPGEYWLFIAERQAMQQDVTVDATAMANGLTAKGSVALYGIFFDTGKSDVKPESEPALKEIAKLLTGSTALKVFIVGHTDMVGDAATNMKLSQARADAVVAVLVAKHGIAAARLVAFGNGPYAPVASNKTDEGRGKNRRVELVEIATK
jgi:OmpA-OmpF porin, OOP family